MSFETLADQKNTKLRLAIDGGPGAGKTFTALLIAQLLGAKKPAVIDSENGRSEKYAKRFMPFAIEKPNEYSIRTYLKLIDEAKKAGVDFLIIDSYSATWNGKGGALQQVDQMGGNKFGNGWKTVSPLQHELVQAINSYPGHVICTMRSKVEYVIETQDGKAVPRKLGLKPIQRDEAEYEFDFLLHMGNDGTVTVQKQQGVEELEGFVGTRKDIPEILNKIKTILA